MRHYYILFAALIACGDDPVTELTATANAFSTAEDTAKSFEIEANIPATFQLTTAPMHGTVTGAGTDWTYTPEANYTGSDALVITANAGQTTLELAIPITVTPVNDAPVANPDSFATNADIALAIDVKSLIANDTDLEGSTLTVTAAASAVSGGVVLAGDQITFTPTLGFAGMATFEYTVSDGEATGTGTVTVSVGVDQAPVAVDDTANTDEDVTLAISTASLLTNDTDADGHILSISDVGNAVNCTVVKIGSTISVTPTLDSNANATFDYTVTDGALTDTGTVTISINAVADVPVASADTATTDEDVPVQIAEAVLLANDTDGDGDTLAITSVTGATLANGVVTFTPAANFNGDAAFTYTVSDGTGNSATATVTVTVGAVPDAPVANADALTVAEDGAGSVDVATNDTDADGDVPALQSFTQPARGVVTFAGSVATYTPVANFNGPDAFTYTITDGTSSATGTVNINVTAVNDAPVAVDDARNVVEETPTIIAALANDTDIDGDTLVFSSVTAPAHGTAQLAGGIVTYTPATNYVGPDGFDYTINDGNGGADVGHVTINVTNVNDAPVARADTIATDENTAVTANVVANDTDADGDALTVQSFTQGAHGTVSFSGPSATFTPATNFSGEDAFTYTISDGKGGTSTATVTVFIGLDNDPPVAVDDTATVVEETPTTINVLGNDSDIDLNTLQVTAVTSATHGTVALVNGVITYTPNDNYFGPDAFDYVVSDGFGGSDIGHVSITVTNVNDKPVATNDTLTTNEDTLATLNVTLNDSDIDGDTLAIQSSVQPTHGTLVFAATVARYTPALNYNGPDSFTYTVTDGNGGTATATVNVTVNAVNDAPVATDDNRTVVEETATTIAVLGNDNDVDGDTVVLTAVGTAAHGSVVLTAGTITYTPVLNYFGPDGFDYTISDGKGGTDVGHVNITVTNVNDAPVAVNDALSTNEDTPRALNVVSNDTDVDGDTLTIQSVAQPATGGTVTFNATTATFTPAPNFNGTTSFTYVVRDPSNATSTGTVSVTVIAVNDPPIAVANAITVNEDTAGSVNVLTNDSDVDGDTLTVTAVTQPANGSATFASPNVTFTPAANFHGTTTFNYTVSDGKGGTATAAVSVTVTSVNDIPNAVNDTLTVDEDTAGSKSVLANDTDVDGDTLTVTAASNGTKGTVTFTTTSVTYTPNLNVNGVDSFTYTISDGNGGTDTATVAVTITPVNDAPIAGDDSITTNEDTAATNVNVRANDSDVEGTALTITAVTQPANGAVVINGGTTVTFTPAPNFNGSTSFTYTVSDGSLTDTATVSVTVNAVNDAPNAVADSITTDEDTQSTAVNLLANDTDVDAGQTLSITASSTPTKGTLTFTGGSVKYQPNANATGNDSFTYTISDGNGGTDTATVAITITAVNDAPVATDDSITTNEDTAATNVNVRANDTDVEGTTLTITAVTQPATGGSVVINAGTTVTFTPTANFNGSTSFTYTVSDGSLTDTATVSVTVNAANDAPIAVDDSLTTAEDTAKTQNVVVNDTDVDGNTLTVTAVSQGTKGAVTFSGGSVTYTPNANATGSDTFSYTVSDGTATDIGTVSVSITATNDAPIAVDDTITTDEDVPASKNLVTNDTDADGDTLTIQSVTQGAKGTVTFAGGTATYTPNANANGSDTFTYVVSDGTATDTGSVTVTITAKADLPIANNDTLTVNEDNTGTVDVLANDSDADGDAITIQSNTQPTSGSVSFTSGTATYIPPPNFNGSTSFTYTIKAGNDLASATVNITVVSVNDAPIANEGSTTTATNQPVTITLTGSDVENQALTFQIVTPPADGTVGAITPASPTSATVDYDPGTFAGTTTFTFTAKDTAGAISAIQTFTITVAGCGDGVVDVNGKEECDDGNQEPGDGCEPITCTFSCASGSGATSVAVDPDTGNCFVGFDTGLNFSAGFEFCDFPVGGHLATVRGSGENAAVLKVLGQMQNKLGWLGATDQQVEGTFEWVSTGEPFGPPTFFAANQSPDPNGVDDCLAASPAGWTDEQCNAQISVICEIEALPPPPPVAPFEPGSAAAVLFDNLSRFGTLTRPVH